MVLGIHCQRIMANWPCFALKTTCGDHMRRVGVMLPVMTIQLRKHRLAQRGNAMTKGMAPG